MQKYITNVYIVFSARKMKYFSVAMVRESIKMAGSVAARGFSFSAVAPKMSDVSAQIPSIAGRGSNPHGFVFISIDMATAEYSRVVAKPRNQTAIPYQK